MERKSFLDQEPPPGYVAGVGRGATGFTTNADSGPVRFESNFGTEDGESGILSNTRKTKEDDEADRIYDEIEKRLLQRRRKRAPDAIANEPHNDGAVIQDFSLLKSQLVTVSAEEWASLPDVGDLTRKNKRQRVLEQQSQRTYAAPDMLISGTGSGFRGISNEKAELANALDKVSSAPVEDQIEDTMDPEVRGDITRNRKILASLRKTEPNRADLWIASARLEESGKKFDAAKALIMEGCSKIPHNEDVWLESIKIHRRSSEGLKKCKAIVNEALRLNTKSEKLWFQAVDLENPADEFSRKRVLMKALEFLPNNVNLWKELVNQESEEESAKRLLLKAIQLCPESWDFWSSLINMSEFSESKKLLNSARKQLPRNPEVWITAIQLEERENSAVQHSKLSSMLSKGFKELEKAGFENDLDFWLDKAKDAELLGFNKSCEAIIDNALSLVLAENSSQKLEIAEKLSRDQLIVSPLRVYTVVVEENPEDIRGWARLFASLKKDKHLKPEICYGFYSKAIGFNPDKVILHLMYAKDAWVTFNDVPKSRQILSDASKKFPDNEQVILARFKLEVKNGCYEEAYKSLYTVINELAELSPRIWYKLVHLVRFLKFKKSDIVKEVDLLQLADQALEHFPDNPKLYLQKSQILRDLDDLAKAREVLSIGTRTCPKDVALWLSVHDIDCALESFSRARSVLDTAMIKIPDSDRLWEAKINLEIKQKDMVLARLLISKALKQFPSSALLWTKNLSMIPKMSLRKNAFLDALKQTGNSTDILQSIGVFFWIDAKFDKAKSWFDRAIAADNHNGDTWSWLYSFMDKQGLEQEKRKLLENVAEEFEEIKSGSTWILVVKDPKNLDKKPSEIVEIVAQKLLETSSTL